MWSTQRIREKTTSKQFIHIMALRIRLQRKGAKNQPKYRIVVAEKTVRRDGQSVEILGDYNPQARGADERCRLNLDRYDYWVSVGAQPSDTVHVLARQQRKAGAKA